MGNIGDMDIELIVPVIKPLDRYGIIEVLGIFAVDRYREDIP